MFRVVNCILLLFIYIETVVDQLPRVGKRELICLLSFTCNYVVFVWRGFLFLWVLGMGYVILLWHSLSLPYNYFTLSVDREDSLTSSRMVMRTEQSTKCLYHISYGG